MKKYLLTSVFASFLIVGLFMFTGTQNCADAKTYGPNAICPNPAAGGKKVTDIYPGQTISSSDIYVTILGEGVPPGIRFVAGANAESCNTVQCLDRNGGGVSGPMGGGRTAVLIDTLGCGGANGGCNDTATVSVGAYDTIVGYNCTWSVSDNGAPGSFSGGNSTTVVLANGTPSSVYFLLTCTPISNTPTESPTPTKTTPTPTKITPTPTKITPTPTTPIVITSSPTPTTPVNTVTPTKSPTPTPTIPICPVPSVPTVTMNCPTCLAN